MYLISLHFAGRDFPDGSEAKNAYNFMHNALRPDYQTAVSYMEERSFVLFVSSFEQTLQDTAALVLLRHKRKVGAHTFTLNEILDCDGDIEVLGRMAVDKKLSDTFYKRPAEYLKALADIVSIDPKPLAKFTPEYVEIKARRDLGVHNGWVCNDQYIRKIREVGLRPTVEVGMYTGRAPSAYYIRSLHVLLELVSEILRQVVRKHVATDPGSPELQRFDAAVERALETLRDIVRNHYGDAEFAFWPRADQAAGP